MKRSITELLQALHDVRQEEMNIAGELASYVDQMPEVKQALKDGLVRLNFKAPLGFRRYLLK